MDLSALKQRTPKGKAAVTPENIAMRLDRIEIGTDGKPSFFHGFKIGTNDPVAVRLMTIDEGVAVNQRKDELPEETKERLKSQYAGTGEKHRPRPAEIAKPDHKSHCAPGGLMLFSKCVQNEDGTYRAHWLETLEKQAGAVCDIVVANVQVQQQRDPKDYKKVVSTSVFADVVRPDAAVIANKENIIPTLSAVFANESGEEKRKPFLVGRLIDTESGKILHKSIRANAAYNEVETKDPDSGVAFKRYVAAPAEDSIKALFNPNNEKANNDELIFKAALFGVAEAEGYPKYHAGVSDAVKAALNDITDAVRAGKANFEMIPGERINAGPATRASILKQAENANHPINTYYQSRSAEGNSLVRRYGDTFLTTIVGQDGNRYFTKAVVANPFGRSQSLDYLATVNDHKATAAAAKERASLAVAEEAPEDSLPLDASVLGNDEDMNNQLASAANAAAEPGYF